jgi:hypothetical protein
MRAEARRSALLHIERHEDRRYKERTNVERVYARLKDEFGGRMTRHRFSPQVIRVRGYAKVMTHLMFGILALTADQLMRLVTQSLT